MRFIRIGPIISNQNRIRSWQSCRMASIYDYEAFHYAKQDKACHQAEREYHNQYVSWRTPSPQLAPSAGYWESADGAIVFDVVEVEMKAAGFSFSQDGDGVGPCTQIAQGEISMSVAFPTHVWKMPNICKYKIVWLFSHVCFFPYICVKIQTCVEKATQV